MREIANHVIIHFGACKLAARQTQQQFSLQRPCPPQASLSWALPGQTWSSHLLASCVIPDQRSHRIRNEFFALTSTLSQMERNWTHFSLSSFCRLAQSVHWKIDLAMIGQDFSYSRTCKKLGPVYLTAWYLLLTTVSLPSLVATTNENLHPSIFLLRTLHLDFQVKIHLPNNPVF